MNLLLNKHTILILWIIFLILTIVILIYPTKWPLEYSSIQSLIIFQEIGTFTILYYIWIISLITLLLTIKHNRDWGFLALLCTFAIVFLYFWVLVTPYGRLWDEPFQLAHLNYLQNSNQIPFGNINLNYFDFPGLQLLGISMLKITGLSLFCTRSIIILVNLFTFIFFLYMLYHFWLKNGRFASLGVLLTLHASIFIMKYTFYFPSTFALTLFVLILFIVSKGYLIPVVGRNYVFLALITFMALSITHFVTALTLIFILFSTYIVNTIYKRRNGLITFSSVVFYSILFLSWLVYLTFSFFPSLVATAVHFLLNEASGIFFISRTIATRVVGSDPIWALITRNFWLIINWVIGPLLWLYSWFKKSKINSINTIITGGLLGIILISAIGLFFSSGGSQVTRFQLYGPLFTIPIILLFIFIRKQSFYKFGLVGFSIIIGLFSLPTFLSLNSNAIIDKTYLVEWSAADFIGQKSTSEKPLKIFTSSEILTGPYIFHSPKAQFFNPPPYSDIKDRDEFIESLDLFISNFTQNRDTLTNNFFIWSKKVELLANNTFDIPSNSPLWNEFMLKLPSNNIYSNDIVTIWIQN